MSSNHTQLAIIGSGPAGYTAAIYAGRAQLSPAVFTGSEAGGQLMYTTELENFPGFPQGVNGPKFMMDLRAQAERFGANIKHELVTAVDFSQQPFKLWAHLPEEIDQAAFQERQPQVVQQAAELLYNTTPDLTADAVIIATGATAIKLGIPGEAEFIGRGVSTCAVCDAAFFKDKQVFVIGGGDSAMEDALALTKFASHVTVVHRRDKFRASKIMQQRVLDHPQIEVLWNSNLQEIKGDQQVSSVVIDVDGTDKEFEADGVFLAIGHRPVSDLFKGQVEMDQRGYVVTALSQSKMGVEMAQQRIGRSQLIQYPTMSSVSGVFAAGDVVDVRYWQAITAAGMGAAAALDAEEWLYEESD